MSSVGCCLSVMVFVACGVSWFVVCCFGVFFVVMLLVVVNRRWLLFVENADVNVVRCLLLPLLLVAVCCLLCDVVCCSLSCFGCYRCWYLLVDIGVVVGWLLCVVWCW